MSEIEETAMIVNKSLLVIFLGTIIYLFVHCGSNTRNIDLGMDNSQKLSLKDSIPIPSKSEAILSNSSKVFYIDNKSVLNDTLINGQKHIKLNGDVFFSIEKGNLPLNIFTSLMEIKVLTPASFRVTAYNADQGQSVESLTGVIRINKAYTSPFPEPDTLHENNLYMVNKSIDLSEKENLDDDKLLLWWNKVKQRSNNNP